MLAARGGREVPKPAAEAESKGMRGVDNEAAPQDIASPAVGAGPGGVGVTAGEVMPCVKSPVKSTTVSP